MRVQHASLSWETKHGSNSSCRCHTTPFRSTCPLILLEQGETLYDNVWTAFLHTLPDYTPGADWHPYTETAAVDKTVLVMPGDIPLATPFEIDEFVDGCDLAMYDYCLGLTSAATLRAYYPQQHRSGIEMAYFTCVISRRGIITCTLSNRFVSATGTTFRKCTICATSASGATWCSWVWSYAARVALRRASYGPSCVCILPVLSPIMAGNACPVSPLLS